jgi:hypothetical protein
MSGRVGSITTGIVSDGLVFNIDAANRASYPKTGTTVTDTIGSINGTISGASFETINNGVFSFDGSDDYIDFGNPTELQITGILTISFWFKSTNTGYQFLVSKDDGTNSCFGIGLRQQKIYATIYSSGLTDIQTTTTWVDGNWHNVVFVFTPSTSMEIFVDGNSEVIETTSIPASIDNDSVNLNIGRRVNSSRYYTGIIPNTQIYNRALSSTEVLHNYNALKDRFQ